MTDPAGLTLVELARKAGEVVIPEAMKGLMVRRQRAAFEILVEALRVAKVDPEEAAARDDVAAMFIKFYHAMAQGAAFANLRVIAQVLAGKAADASARTDDFISWADAIAALTYEEVVFLAVMCRCFSEAYDRQTDPEEARKHGWTNTFMEFSSRLGSKADFQATGMALTRTGFVTLISLASGLSFEPTSRLFRLAEMAQLDAWADDAMKDVGQTET